MLTKASYLAMSLMRVSAPKDLCVLRCGGASPIGAPAGHDPPTVMAIDHPADPQPHDKSRRSRQPLPVPRPRPGRPVHPVVRRCPDQCGHPSAPDFPAVSADELLCRTVTLQAELPDRMLIFGRRHLRTCSPSMFATTTADDPTAPATFARHGRPTPRIATINASRVDRSWMG